MRLVKLALHNFRNFTVGDWQFSQTTLITGPNGIGKTSLVEAINLLASGDSFRANKVEEMIRLSANLGRVQALFELDPSDSDRSVEELKLEVMLTRGQVNGKRSPYRLFSVNDVKKRRKDFLQQLSVVVFRPEDLRLVEGSPSRRRGFFDNALSMSSWEYAQHLSQYERVLSRRNKVLQQIAEQRASADSLSFWNLNLLKHGQFLQQERARLVDFIREVIFPMELNIAYLPSLLTERSLQEHLGREMLLGHSLIGPHKDDFLLKFSIPSSQIEDLSLLAYGSRGQQRLGVLWLKIAELQFLHGRIGYQPILVLDDIMSELDEQSQQMVLELISQYQTIITTADEEVVAQLQTAIKDLSLIKL